MNKSIWESDIIKYRYCKSYGFMLLKFIRVFSLLRQPFMLKFVHEGVWSPHVVFVYVTKQMNYRPTRFNILKFILSIKQWIFVLAWMRRKIPQVIENYLKESTSLLLLSRYKVIPMIIYVSIVLSRG